MRTATMVAASMATFGLGYLQALVPGHYPHPGWFFLAVLTVAVADSLDALTPAARSGGPNEPPEPDRSDGA